jgi:ABC-type nitrate/sulfonate/bicarbonate transport system substrate-binding protein
MPTNNDKSQTGGKSKAKFWVLGVCVLLCLCALGVAYVLHARATQPKSLRVSLSKTAFFLPLIVAVDKGFFQEQHLTAQLDYYNSTNTAINAFVTGNSDVTALGSGALFALEISSPRRVQLLYGQNSSSYCLVVPGNSAITDLEQVRGLKIGTWPSPTAKAFLHLILDSRIGKDGFEVVPMESRFLNQAMSRGDVGMLFETDVFAQQAIASGIGRYLAKNAMEKFVRAPFFNGGGIMSTSRAEKDPNLKERLVKIFSRTIEYMNAHPTETRDILAKALAVSPDIARDAPIDKFFQLGDIDRQAAQQVVETLHGAGIIKESVAVQSLF